MEGGADAGDGADADGKATESQPSGGQTGTAPDASQEDADTDPSLPDYIEFEGGKAVD